MKNRIIFTLSIFLFFTLVFMLFGCTRRYPIEDPDKNPDAFYNEKYIIEGVRYYDTVKALAASRDSIVIGRVIEEREVVNTSGKIDSLDVGQVYAVQVDQYLKGEGDNIIFVINIEGTIDKENVGLQFTEADVQAAKERSPTPKMVVDRPYILFLVKTMGSQTVIERENYYYSSPIRLDISDPKNVVAETDLDIRSFPRDLDSLIKHILDPITYPYPDPGYRRAPIPDETPPAPQDPSAPYPDPESASSSNQNEVLVYPPP